MAERMVKANGIDICAEAFGLPGDSAILLVMGAGAQGILWPDEFCQELAEAGHYVIRYDNRDTGLSTCFDFAKDPYTLSDMANDAVGVLDAYGVHRAHVVGASMGGMIAQTLAIEHPERVATITSIMSSPAGAGVSAAITGGEAAEGLPGPAPRLLEAIAHQAAHPAVTDDERVEAAVYFWGALAGRADPPEPELVRQRERQVLARAKNIDASNNHGLAIAISPDRMDALRRVEVPALVIHGDDDPILPLPHGQATANCIAGSKLIVIEGMGHDLPPRAAPTVVAAILDHTR